MRTIRFQSSTPMDGPSRIFAWRRVPIVSQRSRAAESRRAHENGYYCRIAICNFIKGLLVYFKPYPRFLIDGNEGWIKVLTNLVIPIFFDGLIKTALAFIALS